MNEELNEKLAQACWIARELFSRKMGPGTTGNLSFLHEGYMYITAGGTCFGNLKPEDFSKVSMQSGEIEGPKPSKELPLHRIVYENDEKCEAVIHVHSTYAVLWSCIPHENEIDCIPSYTPYLKMKLGTVGLIPYEKPGSQELFDAFKADASKSDGWILKNHGPVVGGKNLMSAFTSLEELEESCRIAWELRDMNVKKIDE